jgi:hypothetical protein
MMREMPMKALLFAAALVFLAGAPFAQAFQTVPGDKVPVANAPRVADPEDIMDNLANQDALSGTAASPVGNTLRFGIPATNGGSLGAPGPFLESPASRTVPSQQR